MATFRLLLVAALLALPLWVAHSAPAHACTLAPSTLEDDVRSADIIAVGTIGEVLVLPPESVAHPETLPAGFMPVEAKFAVSEYLKGSGPATLLRYQTAEEITYDNGAISSILTSRTTCGSVVSVGTRYVTFLKKFDTLRYSSASGTSQFANDQDVVDYIAQIRVAVVAEQVGLPPTGSGPTHHSAPTVPLAVASVLVTIGLAANAAFALRRRRSR
jgi:hypothetical protein